MTNEYFERSKMRDFLFACLMDGWKSIHQENNWKILYKKWGNERIKIVVEMSVSFLLFILKQPQKLKKKKLQFLLLSEFLLSKFIWVWLILIFQTTRWKPNKVIRRRCILSIFCYLKLRNNWNNVSKIAFLQGFLNASYLRTDWRQVRVVRSDRHGQRGNNALKCSNCAPKSDALQKHDYRKKQKKGDHSYIIFFLTARTRRNG